MTVIIQFNRQAIQTKHDWHFKLAQDEKLQAKQCADNIKKDTKEAQSLPNIQPQIQEPQPLIQQQQVRGPKLPTKDELMNLQDLQLKRELEQEMREKERQYENKQWKKQQMEEINELLPQKVGKEAIIEKKRLLNQKINGSKDESGLDDFKESELFGDDPLSSFKLAKNFEEKKRNKYLEKQQIRKKEQMEKFSNYQQKESEKLAFLASLKHLSQLKK